MEIKEDEVKEVKKIGTLHGSEVKVVSLKGGLHIGMGKKNKTSRKSEILAVASHPAIVSHQIESQYNKFEQSMNKNETENMSTVEDFSHNLNSMQKNVLGLDIYAIKKNETVEFKITKNQVSDVFSIKASESGQEITLEKTEKNKNRLDKLDRTELSKSLDKSIKEYANKNGLKIKKNF